MARVYVGTYGKYNSGSIEGAWIDLATCSDYSAFLEACRKAHKDEVDPEFMIQDYSELPDGLACMEWLSKKEFDDIKAAMSESEDTDSRFTIIDYSEKAIAVIGDTRHLAEELRAIGGRFNARLTCGPGWVFSKTKEQEVRAIISESSLNNVDKPQAPKCVAALDEWLGTIKSDSDRAYYKRVMAAAVKLPEGYVIIEKPSINNRFCFHDEGPDYNFYCTLMSSEKKLETYFLEKNLEGLNNELDILADINNQLYIRKLSNDRLDVIPRVVMERFYSYELTTSREISEKERLDLHNATRYVRDAFKKRLQTYLKRYGVSKIHTWTYWADA